MFSWVIHSGFSWNGQHLQGSRDCSKQFDYKFSNMIELQAAVVRRNDLILLKTLTAKYCSKAHIFKLY